MKNYGGGHFEMYFLNDEACGYFLPAIITTLGANATVLYMLNHIQSTDTLSSNSGAAIHQ